MKRFGLKKQCVLFLITICVLSVMFSSSASAINTGQLPLPAYPAGSSYFSYSGNACSHHIPPNYPTCSTIGLCECKSFAGAIQCMGFAKYAYAQFSNMTELSFSTYYDSQLNNASGQGDVKKRNKSITDETSARSAFSGLKRGAYVRVRKRYKPNDHNGNGHSFVVLSVTNSYVTVYEANYAPNCAVNTRIIYFTEMHKEYDMLTFAIQHKYPTVYSNYNASYHVAACTTSGCTGKTYQQHYAASPGPNAVCLGCGYHGYISIGYNELPDVSI